MSKKNSELVLYRGEKFSSQGHGKFAKDIVRVGAWRHPATGRLVEFDHARVQKLAKLTNEYLENGNKVPFPDGHSFSVKDNLGFWPGPFMEHKGSLVGVVEPKDELATKKMLDGTLDSVSAMIEYGVTDPKGKVYEEVITHVCATNYPVITGQKAFMELSAILGGEGRILLAPEGLSFEDAAAVEAMDKFVAALEALDQMQFERCVMGLKGKGQSKEAAIKACQARFKKTYGMSTVDTGKLAAALEELSKVK